MPHRDPEQRREYQRQWREASRERLREYQRQWREANAEHLQHWRQGHREPIRGQLADAERRRTSDLRIAVLDHYGRICTCCGSKDGLTIDHVNGDGREHREELFGRQVAGAPFYLWLVRQGFPDGFQALCRRCNTSKRNGLACRLDHQEIA